MKMTLSSKKFDQIKFGTVYITSANTSNGSKGFVGIKSFYEENGEKRPVVLMLGGSIYPEDANKDESKIPYLIEAKPAQEGYVIDLTEIVDIKPDISSQNTHSYIPWSYNSEIPYGALLIMDDTYYLCARGLDNYRQSVRRYINLSTGEILGLSNDIKIKCVLFTSWSLVLEDKNKETILEKYSC